MARNDDPLASYRKKRSADRTTEPFAADSGTFDAKRFVIQHHAARATHYDLRLEMDGVLVSWAVPKGPSPNPREKRLAVRVEDHPLDYANFEGRIPEGNYGAGAVVVWDRGVWQPLNDPREGLNQGKLLFQLRGYKLRGKWTLVKTKRGAKDWLLIKERDAYVAEDAGTDSYPPDSILSGRTVADIAEDRDLGAPILERLQQSGAPQRALRGRQVKPMLATPGRPFSNEHWLFELKFDGYRLIVEKSDEAVRAYSRNGNDLTEVFPEITEAVTRLPFAHLVLDAEAVVHDEQGLPSFQRLQKRGRLTRRQDISRAAIALPATLYVFDLLGFDGFDLRPLPLLTRKALLKAVLPTVGPLRYSDHVKEHGETLFENALHLGLEGIVAKRADAPYRGGRGSAWQKIVGERRDDFVIVGFTPSKDAGRPFGALLLAQYLDGTLRYSGRVGSGFGSTDQRRLAAQLMELELDTAAAPQAAPSETGLQWCAPALVCEARFKERTDEGLLRQPVFLRLRDDKSPEECVLPSHEPPAFRVESDGGQRQVPLTNLDKVFWPEDGLSKGDLIHYYDAISPWLLPYLRERPVVLDRYPDGIHGKSFFQKDAPGYVPDWLRVQTLWSEHTGREIRYFIVDDEASLRYLINMGTIPLHIWASRIGSLEQPDWCILDLDPKDAPFTEVVTIARRIHGLCQELALPDFIKTSGSSGLHVLIPLGRQLTYEQTRMLAQLLANVVVRELPDIATVVRSPSRRQGKVYVDYGQNGHGRLLVAPFSVRPLPGAPVSMPLSWNEVNARLSIGKFTLKNALPRMKRKKKDPLAGVLTQRADVLGGLDRLAALVN